MKDIVLCEYYIKRSECFFGILSNMFPTLTKPWQESEQKLDDLVLIGTAIHNVKLNN